MFLTDAHGRNDRLRLTHNVHSKQAAANNLMYGGLIGPILARDNGIIELYNTHVVIN